MLCQKCGVEAATKRVAFYQNIGALVMRFHSSVQGELCKRCIHKTFWTMTLVNCTVGWWGVISFIVTPFFVVNNVARYAMCVKLPPTPKDARPPALDTRAVERLQGVTERLVERLNRGEPLDKVLADTASIAGVTPGQVMLYLRALSAAAEQPRS